jgi:hypothetical protein
MRGRKLRRHVNWQGALNKKGVKQVGRKLSSTCNVTRKIAEKFITLFSIKRQNSLRSLVAVWTRVPVHKLQCF